jgi:hypothetical protein
VASALPLPSTAGPAPVLVSSLSGSVMLASSRPVRRWMLLLAERCCGHSADQGKRWSQVCDPRNRTCNTPPGVCLLRRPRMGVRCL